MKDKCINKKCSEKKICNPKTGRCVLRRGRIGKKLAKVSPRRKCSDDKIYNPKTGRCVLRRGIIGKKLLQKNPKKKSRRKSRRKKSQNSLCMPKDRKIFNEEYDVKIDKDKIKVIYNSEIVREHKKSKNIYNESQVIVDMYKSGKNRVVLKKETTDNPQPSEFIIYKILKKHKCGLIRLRYVKTVKKGSDYTHYYIMDAFDGDLEDITKKRNKSLKFDPLVLGGELKKQLTCLYTNIKPPLWYTDLKDANVFYCSGEKQKGLPGKIYLGDLGSLAKIDGEHIATYPPPEVRAGQGFFEIKDKEMGKKIISWVTGVTILQTIVGSTYRLMYRFIDKKNVKEIESIVSNYLRDVKDKKIKKILQSLLEVDPRKRKSLEEIKF